MKSKKRSILGLLFQKTRKKWERKNPEKTDKRRGDEKFRGLGVKKRKIFEKKFFFLFYLPYSFSSEKENQRRKEKKDRKEKKREFNSQKKKNLREKFYSWWNAILFEKKESVTLKNLFQFFRGDTERTSANQIAIFQLKSADNKFEFCKDFSLKSY